MDRSLRSTYPNLAAILELNSHFCMIFENMRNRLGKSREKLNFDKRHNVRNLPSLKNDLFIYIRGVQHAARGPQVARQRF